MGNVEVLEALYPLFLKHGKPEFIRSDNGPEFIAENFQTWLARIGIKPIRIYPGSPWGNGYNEPFNGTLRREVLNAEVYFNQTGSGRHRNLAEAVQPHPPASGFEHASTGARDSIRKWYIKRGLYSRLNVHIHPTNLLYTNPLL